MTPLFEAIVQHVSPPPVDMDGPFQMRVTSLSYSNYVGIIGIGRVQRGRIKPNTQVSVVGRDGKVRQGKVMQVMGFLGLERLQGDQARAGENIGIFRIETLGILDN